MKKPLPPTKDLTLSEASSYLDSVIDYYTDVLGQEVQEYDTRKKIYESTTLA